MELLAPAGGPEQLRTAVHFGADAVYVAARRWGMRSRSENFSESQLAEAVALAHRNGVTVHLALNTLMTDDDIAALPEFLATANELGVDAAIVSDLGALELVRAYAPGVTPHVSTHASVMNARAADAYARLGARRIVLAREMSLERIRELRRLCSRELELEAFVHGSMCVAYSGRCLLSAELMGGQRSASWGACAQPCRWGWSLVEDRDPTNRMPLEQDAQGSYLLSSNDLCMLDHLGELEAAGVCSAKIEGRAKGTYYVATVTNAYRHVIDGDAPAAWRDELDAVSHRPYSTGFYFDEPTQNPGRIEYARERTMAGVVQACERAEGGRDWIATVQCRNRCDAGASVEVLAPGQPVRTFVLREGLIRAMEPYAVHVPWPLEADDVLCCDAQARRRP